MARDSSFLTAALAAAFALLAVPSGASAESEVELAWRLAGGTTFPVEPGGFRDLYTAGLNLEVGLGVLVPRGIRLICTYDLNSFFVNESAVTERVRSVDPSYDPGQPADSSPGRIHAGLVQAVVPVTGSTVAAPYAIGAIGWMWVRSGDITYPDGKIEGKNQTGFALALGLGVDFRVARDLDAFLEAAWSLGLTSGDHTQYSSIRVGISR